MRSHLTSLLSTLLAVAPVGAQCFAATGAPVAMQPDSSAATFGYSPLDEGYSNELPLGFTFPMAGVGYAITHVVVDSNTEVYLTNGSARFGPFPTEAENFELNLQPSNYGTGSLGSLRGGVGAAARIVAHGGDCLGPHPTSQVLVDTSVPGACKITWLDWSEFAATDSWDVSVTLLASGEVRLDWSSGHNPSANDYCGVSRGNAVGTSAATASDLSAGGDSGSLGLVFENGWGLVPFDLEYSSVTFAPNGLGGFAWSRTCQLVPASHQAFGLGCYDLAEANQAFYAFYPDAAAAAAALAGTSIVFTPTAAGDGYDVVAGGASYVPPSPAATDLGLGDDQQVPVVLATPFPHVAGPCATLHVCSNGFVSTGPGNNVFSYGSVAQLLGSPDASFRCNLDLDPTAGGAVLAEQVGNVLHVTWRDVPRFGGVAPERLQMQFDLTTGAVAMVFAALSSFGSGDMVVGYAPGPSLDPGPIVFATALPLQTSPDVLAPAMAMAASPAPVSTPQAGTTVVYQIDHIPDAWTNSGVFFGVTIVSLGGGLPGFDLGSLGAPGCFLYVAGLDETIAFVGATPSNTTQFLVPPGVAPGTEFFAQSAALVFPGSLPNGQNAFGAVTSNAVRSYVNVQ